MKKFKEYLNEVRGKEFHTGTSSTVGSQANGDTPVFKFKQLGLDSYSEEPAGREIPHTDKIKIGDVIIGISENGKKKIGRVTDLIKNSNNQTIFYKILPKDGKQIKVDASKVYKKDYHEVKTNRPFTNQ